MGKYVKTLYNTQEVIFGSKNDSICPTTQGNKVLEKSSGFILRWGKESVEAECGMQITQIHIIRRFFLWDPPQSTTLAHAVVPTIAFKLRCNGR
jgi:hypothetical protein